MARKPSVHSILNEPAPINLDALDIDDLKRIARRYRNAQKWHATFLFPNIFPTPDLSIVRAIGYYASSKASAMTARMEGDIQWALRREQTCEEIYNKLPFYAKW